MIERGDWQVSDIARNAFDLEGKVVGTIGAGRIGYRVLQRLVPFDCKELLYYDYAPLPTGIVPSNLMFWYRRLYLDPSCSRGREGSSSRRFESGLTLV
jgi:hypothetical protein